jgi:hypothetical protein
VKQKYQRNIQDDLREAILVRDEIRSAVTKLTTHTDIRFQLSLIVYDKESFGNKIVLLVSEDNLNIRYIKDRGNLDFYCGLKWEKAPEVYFRNDNVELYSEKFSYLRDDLQLTEKEKEFVLDVSGWFNLDEVLEILQAQSITQAIDFFNYISLTADTILANLPLILNIFKDDDIRKETIRMIKEKRAYNLKKMWESYGEVVEDSAINKLVGLDESQ